MELNDLEIFLIKCAGGDKNLLDKDKVPIEYNKLVGIGGAVILTAIYAAFAIAYAASWIFFDDKATILLISIFWGLAIFNLDRLIVSTTYKKISFQLSDVFQLLFRVALTCIIALTISVPLEIKFFEPELIKKSLDTRIASIDSETEIVDLSKKSEKALKDYSDERDGKGPTGKIGKKTHAKDMLEDANIAERKLNDVKNRRKEEIKSEVIGFISLYDALDLYKRENPTANKISIAITLLLLLFELTPVLVKFTLQRGNYDERIEAREIKGRIKMRKKLETFTKTKNLENIEIPNPVISATPIKNKENTQYSPESQGKSNIWDTIKDYSKGKLIDVVLAIFMGFILATFYDGINIPTFGGLVTYLMNSYLIPKSDNA